jgi:hypothetical protein
MGRAGDVAALRPSPAVVAVTVARLDESSSWRRYTVDAAGERWVRLDQLLVDPAALDTWVGTELRATARGHADLAGALIVYRLAGALAELVVGTLVDQGRDVVLSPAAVALRFGAAARLDEVSGAAPTVAMLPDDAGAGAPGVVVVPSTVELRRIAADGLVAVFRPVTQAVRARAPFGLRGMWGTLADHIAEVAVRRARERGHDVGAAWAEASRLIDDLAAQEPLLVTRPRRQLVTTPGGDEVLVAKGTCCLIYKAAEPPTGAPPTVRRLIDTAACTSCPLRPEPDRAARFAAYLADLSRSQRP